MLGKWNGRHEEGPLINYFSPLSRVVVVRLAADVSIWWVITADRQRSIAILRYNLTGFLPRLIESH